MRSAGVGYWVFNAAGTTREVSPRLAGWLGCSVTDLWDIEALLARLHADDRAGMALTLGDCALGGIRFTNDVRIGVGLRVLQISGEPLSSTLPGTLPGGRRGILLAVRDITAARQREEQLHQLAFFDGITGLTNHHHFLAQLRKVVRRPYGRHDIGILVFHLANLATLEGSHDEALSGRYTAAFAAALTASLRQWQQQQPSSSTNRLVSYLGNGEFAVLFDDEVHGSTLTAAGHWLLEQLRQPLSLGTYQLHPVTTLGMALWPEAGSQAEALLWSARAAAHQALAEGPAVFFSHDTQARAARRLMLENELHGAAARGELELLFQPRVTLSDRRIAGAEALVRWQHPTLGYLSPSEFIPLAEECGVIRELGAWVLEAACHQLPALAAAHGGNFQVSVNLSTHQLEDHSLVPLVRQLLTHWGIHPQNLELEVTESALMDAPEQAREVLAALRQLGVRIALDDFGTGHSSLAQLRQLPLDIIKIDQSFVQEVRDDSSAQAVIDAVVALCRSLGLHIIAEGIETAEQASYLAKVGCDEGQGYLFSRPITTESLLEMLASAN